MSQNNVVFLNLERLPDYDANNYWFGLTVSTALLGNHTTIEAPYHLKPWRWERCQALTVFDETGQAVVLNPIPTVLDYCVDATGAARGPRIDRLVAGLEAKYTSLKDSKGTPSFVYDENPTDPNAADWTALLEDAVRLPAPLGQWLHLACIFTIDRNAGVDTTKRLYAAPRIVSAQDEAGSVETFEAVAATPTSDTAPRTVVQYQSTSTHSIVGHSQGLAASVAFGAAPTLWLAEPDWGGKEWFARLPKEVADAADVATRLVNAARLCRKSTATVAAEFPSIRNEDAILLRESVLRALRIGAHAGARRNVPPRPDVPEWKYPSMPTAHAVLDLMPVWPLSNPLPLIESFNALHDLEDGYPDLATRIVIWTKLLKDQLGERTPPFVRRVADLDLKKVPGSDVGTALKAALGEETATLPLLPTVEELETLLGAVQDNDFLAQLILSQWKEAGVDEPWLTTYRVSLIETLKTLSLRNRLTLDSFGARWADMTQSDTASSDNDIEDLRKAFAVQAEQWLGRYFPANSTVPFPQSLYAHAKNDIGAAKDALGPEGHGQSILGADTDVQSAHPVTLVVGRTRGSKVTRDDEYDSSDIGRKAGQAILLRQAAREGHFPASTWACLTLAKTGLWESDADTEDPVLELGINPQRVVELAGLETSGISYDNRPLTAAPIAAGFDSTRIVQPHPDLPVPSDPFEDRWVTHRQVETATVDGAPKSFPLPALKFGQAYETAAFTVAMTGALPSALVRVDGSGTPQPLSLAPDKLELAAGAKATPFRYLRRTPASAFRLLNKDAIRTREEEPVLGSPLRLPPIPREDGVWPRAEELAAYDSATQKDDDWKTQQLGELLLLVPNVPATWLKAEERSKFEFALRPPAVDLEVYHRWRAMDAYTEPDGTVAQRIRDEIESVFTGFYANAPKSPIGDPAQEQPKADLSVDEPPVKWLLVRLKELEPEQSVIQKLVALPNLMQTPNPDPACPLPQVQAPPCPVKVEVGAALEITGTSWTGITVTVPSGTVARLEFMSLTEAKWYDPQLAFPDPARFRAAAPEIWEDTQAPTPARYAVVAGVELLVEVAGSELPQPEEILEAIDVLGQRGHELAVGFNPCAGTTNLFRFVKNVTLERQRWNWRGRRLSSEFPINAIEFGDTFYALEDVPGNPGTEARWNPMRKWDATGFGDRFDEDRLTVQGAVAAPPPGSRPVSKLDYGTPLHNIDLFQNPQALYYRYQASVTSRYLGLMTPQARRDAVKRTEKWRRLVLKARPVQAPPAPKIRFILPLTQPVALPRDSENTLSSDPVAERKKAAPLLLMLHETWAQEYGPIEGIEVEIVKAERRYDRPEEEVEEIKGWEIGYDPIDSKERLSTPAAQLPDLPAGYEIKVEPLPIGLTFDPPGTQAPLPSTTSWVVTCGDAEPGVFAKLRFRKALRPEGVYGYAANDPRHKGPWSDSDWVQLLPNSHRLNLDKDGSACAVPGELAITVTQKEGGEVELSLVRRSDFGNVTVYPHFPQEGSKRVRFIAWAITEVLKDAGGGGARNESESMLALGLYDDDGSLRFYPEPTTARFDSSRRYRARALEIEHHSLLDADDERRIVHPDDRTAPEGAVNWQNHPLFKALFPPSDYPDRAIARIVCVYPPIEDQNHHLRPE